MTLSAHRLLWQRMLPTTNQREPKEKVKDERWELALESTPSQQQPTTSFFSLFPFFFLFQLFRRVVPSSTEQCSSFYHLRVPWYGSSSVRGNGMQMATVWCLLNPYEHHYFRDAIFLLFVPVQWCYMNRKRMKAMRIPIYLQFLPLPMIKLPSCPPVFWY